MAVDEKASEEPSIRIQPIDISYIMDQVGKTLVESIQKVIDHFVQAIIDLIRPKVFDDAGDVREFGRRLSKAVSLKLEPSAHQHSVEDHSLLSTDE